MDNQTLNNLRDILSNTSEILYHLQKDGPLFLKTEFDDEAVLDAMLIFGAIAKNVGYRRDILNDENIAEKVNNLLRLVEDWTGVSYPKY